MNVLKKINPVHDVHQLGALSMKSITLQARQYKTNCCQLLFPVILLAFVFLLQLLVDANTPNTGTITVHERNATSIPMMVLPFLWMSPNLSAIAPEYYLYNRHTEAQGIGSLDEHAVGSGLLQQYVQQMPNINFTKMLPYFVEMESSKKIDEDIYDRLGTVGSEESNMHVIGAYEFQEFDSNINSAKLSYTVQFDNMSSTVFCGVLSSFGSCAAMVSNHMINQIDSAFIHSVSGGRVTVMSTTQEMPFTTKVESMRVGDLMGIFFYPFIMMLMLPVFMYTIVLEKQGRLRDMMSLMGLKMHNYWIVTFIFFYIMYCIQSLVFVIMCVILQFRWMHASPVVLLLIFGFWGINIISIAFFLSSFIGKAIVAVVGGYLVAIFGPTAAVLVEVLVFTPGVWWQRIFMIIPPLPLSHSILTVVGSCTLLDCIKISALWEAPDLYWPLIYMLIDSVVLILLGVYFDQVLPQPWGIRKSVFFPIEWIWRPFLKKRKAKKEQEEIEKHRHKSLELKEQVPSAETVEVALSEQQPNMTIEVAPAAKATHADIENHESSEDAEMDEDVWEEKRKILDGECTPQSHPVFIKSLVKRYKTKGGGKFAVRDLSLSISKDECFGLLGPNGAGKTTTISMLCGSFPPTRGEAYVSGYSIRNEIDKVHLSMGLCPQFDVLWDDLNCTEHLLFYAGVKGVPLLQRRKHVKELMKKVGLDKNKGGSLVKNLSGGMRRRLSIAIAMVGNPAIVMLDEPTTGLDPTSRRQLWDVVMEAKKGRCIILTTHSLEEADVLCDRIGIMSRGLLKCVGTSLHLKNKFGEGFRLSINFDERDQEKAMGYVHDTIPQAKILVSFAGNVTYEIAKTKDFRVSKVFQDMEANKELYGIKDWALSQTTLEDVFLSIIRSDEIDGNAK